MQGHTGDWGRRSRGREPQVKPLRADRWSVSLQTGELDGLATAQTAPDEKKAAALKKLSQDAVFGRHTPLNTAGVALQLEVRHAAKPNQIQELLPQTKQCPGSHKSSKSSRKLSSSTKFPAKLDNFKHFPTHSIQQYSFHHPFPFPRRVGWGGGGNNVFISSSDEVSYRCRSSNTAANFQLWPLISPAAKICVGKKKNSVCNTLVSLLQLLSSSDGGGGLFSAAANWLTSGWQWSR